MGFLDVVGSTYASNGKKVVGVEPSYSQVYSHVTSVKGAAITIPLTADYRQDMQALIRTAKRYYREVGFVYLCNPNNPTGVVVTKGEIKQLLDGLPEDMPVLIDEAYHHFVEDSSYATSIPYVLEGRPVIIARTFSKIAALAGMRLGYAVATPEMILKLRPWASGSATGTSALVKWGAVASLKDVAAQQKVKEITLRLRKKTTADLQALGYDVLPSEANFFMVHVRRQVLPIVEEFRKRGVLVGRPVLWGLAVGGAAGVERVLSGLAGELRLAMALCGAVEPGQLVPDLVAGPRGPRPGRGPARGPGAARW